MTTPSTEWPATAVPEPIKQLIGRFFVLGDTPTTEAGREFGEEIFAADGKIIINEKNVISGTAELSQHFIPGLKGREHVVHKIYSCNNAGDDLMLFGTVTWTFMDDSKDNGGFAARAVIVHEKSGKPQIKLYQGWADVSGMMAGMTRHQ